LKSPACAALTSCVNFEKHFNTELLLLWQSGDAHYLAATAVGCDGPRDVDSVCSAAPFYPKVDRWVVSLLATPVGVGAASQR